MSNEDHTSDDLMADAAQSAIAIKYPTSPSLQTPRRSSLSPVKTDRALKDSINIAIYELVKDHGDWTWQMIANEVWPYELLSSLEAGLTSFHRSTPN